MYIEHTNTVAMLSKLDLTDLRIIRQCLDSTEQFYLLWTYGRTDPYCKIASLLMKYLNLTF